MASYTELVQLISSLSASEREAVMSGRKGKGKLPEYLRLFKALSAGRAFEQYSSNPSRVRTYLFDAIVVALAQKTYAPAQGHLPQNLAVIGELLQRGLAENAWKRIQMLKKDAREKEHFTLLTQLLEMELHAFTAFDPGRKFDLKDWEEQVEEAFYLAQELARYQALFLLFQPAFRENFREAGEVPTQVLERCRNHSLLQADQRPKSCRARLFLLRVRLNFHAYDGDENQTWQVIEEIYQTLHEAPFLIGEDEVFYVNSLGKYSWALLGKCDFEAAQKVHRQLAQYTCKSKEAAFQQFKKLIIFKLDYAYLANDFSHLEQLRKELEAGFICFSSFLPLSTKYLLCIKAAHISLMANEPEKALIWLREILNNPRKGVREDIQILARFFLMVAYFEVKEDDITVNSLVVSTSTYLSRRKKKFNTIESALLAFFRAYPHEQSEALKKKQKLVDTLSNVPQKELNVYELEILNWAQRLL
ncbi:MAG: hypothetical protein H6581_01915 [Bacteroidia bacterium]|nr:hypothetical protein [Bacteroidia bacterium]